jgi:hypothetical protein
MIYCIIINYYTVYQVCHCIFGRLSEQYHLMMYRKSIFPTATCFLTATFQDLYSIPTLVPDFRQPLGYPQILGNKVKPQTIRS